MTIGDVDLDDYRAMTGLAARDFSRGARAGFVLSSIAWLVGLAMWSAFQ